VVPVYILMINEKQVVLQWLMMALQKRFKRCLFDDPIFVGLFDGFISKILKVL